MEEEKKKQLKKHIYENFNINLKDELVDVIFDCTVSNEKLKTYAIIGDHLIDFIDSFYQKEESPATLDNFRQKYAENEYWIKCFDAWNFQSLISYTHSNPLGKTIKASFIEALIFCFFEETKDLKKTYNALTHIRSRC